MHDRLHMDREDIGPGLGEFRQKVIGPLDHQVDVQRKGGAAAHRLHDGRADGQVGDEMAVHDIHMDIIGAGLFHGPDLFAEAGEVGGKNGRGDLHCLFAVLKCANFYRRERRERREY